MKLQIAALGEYLRSSLWFIPTLCVGAAFILAEVALQVDKGISQDGDSWFLFGGGIDSARTVVGTIATSMLTFTGLVFSITMLVLQLASNQLSPRVMRTFLRDRANQLVLGVFVATFLYSLLVLRRISSGLNNDPFVPALSVWLALVLLGLSIGLFIFYIHHMAQAIRPGSVMKHVADETRQVIVKLYPSGIGATPPDDEFVEDVAETAQVLSPGPSGVLTRVDEGLIIAVAKDTGCIVELSACVGDFVRQGAPLFTIRREWDGSGDVRLQAAVRFGTDRSMEQDAAFGLRQLVDIGDRALSPGTNDPTTAVQAIDQIHGLLGVLVLRGIPSAVRAVGDGAYVVLPHPGWADYVNLACDEIRRSGQGQIQIQRRLRAMLRDLLEVASEVRRRPLLEQLGLLEAHLRSDFDGDEASRAAAPSPQGNGPLESQSFLQKG